MLLLLPCSVGSASTSSCSCLDIGGVGGCRQRFRFRRGRYLNCRYFFRPCRCRRLCCRNYSRWTRPSRHCRHRHPFCYCRQCSCGGGGDDRRGGFNLPLLNTTCAVKIVPAHRLRDDVRCRHADAQAARFSSSNQPPRLALCFRRLLSAVAHGAWPWRRSPPKRSTKKVLLLRVCAPSSEIAKNN